MRLFSAFVALLVVAAATLGMGPAGTAPAKATYDVAADTIEGCSCPLFCTCYFGASRRSTCARSTTSTSSARGATTTASTCRTGSSG